MYGYNIIIYLLQYIRVSDTYIYPQCANYAKRESNMYVCTALLYIYIYIEAHIYSILIIFTFRKSNIQNNNGILSLLHWLP